MNKYAKIFISIIILFLLFYLFYLRFSGEKIVFEDKNCNYPMLWLHAAGSQERLKYALKNKYCGVEIDITFSSDRGLIASYNNPNDKNAPDLENLISNNSSIKYWWLDVKNINVSNALDVSEIIHNLSSRYNKNVFLIESHNFIGLWLLRTKSEDVYKIYWLAKGPKKNNNISWSSPFYYFRSVLANIIIDPDFVSMFHYQVGNSDFLWVGKRERFAFTINTSEEYNNLSTLGVSVILTDDLKISK